MNPPDQNRHPSMRINHRLFQLIFILYLYAVPCSSQIEFRDTVLVIPEKSINVSREAETNPSLLAKELTSKLGSEREKFDAIFSWVVSNIRYNYTIYFSPGGSYSNVRATLRGKSAVCLGYAELMDTLCLAAGITNISVYGYAKDEFSDTHDSLFIDNHAWNAVKLDGLWYLYDATWSTGSPEFELSRYNKWKSKVLAKASKKYKRKKIKKRSRFFYSDDCGRYSSPAYRYKPRLWNRLYLRLLRRLKVHYKYAYRRTIRTEFYLSQPEVFAITHFPDDAVWSLTQRTNINRFENDSAYYLIHDSIYKNQVREGKECSACDEYYESKVYNRDLILRTKSAQCNPKNHCVQSMCNYNLGEANRKNAETETDSLTALHFADSAIYYFSEARRELKETKSGIIREFKLLTQKNRRKLILLLNENKVNRDFVSGRVRVTLEQGRNFRRIRSRARALSRNYQKRAAAITGYIAREPKVVPVNNSKTIQLLETKLREKESLLDSLTKARDDLKAVFNPETELLSENIWLHVMGHDSIFIPFYKTIRLRAQLKDNYKKVVVDQRKELDALKRMYSSGLQKMVYQPAININDMFKRIIRLIDMKNAVESECLGLRLKLLRQGAITVSEVESYKKQLIAGRKEDYCWLENYLPHLSAISYGLSGLRGSQEDIFDLISQENHMERLRYRALNDEYLRRDKKHKNIVSGNTSVVKVKINSCLKRKKQISGKKKKTK